MSDDELRATPVGFALSVLGLELYPWQAQAATWFELAPVKTVQGTVSTPNESGKSSYLIPTLVLWWLFVHPMGKVVVTTKSGLQLDSQILPAIRRHSAKFPGWAFNERKITTPTKGEAIFFTTDEAARAEGHHPLIDKFTGPVLIIVDEAKSVEEEIFDAIDRCGYSALLYTSSPGHMYGRFWESHTNLELTFKRMKVGLLDCPHIAPDKIARIIAQHGEHSPLTLSTLHGEFMLDGAESRFDFEGLELLQRISENTHNRAQRGVISEHEGTFTFMPDPRGWAWISEHPIEGRSYLAFADPMSGVSDGTKKDTHGCGVLREGFLDQNRTHNATELAAAIYVEDKEAFSGAACRWELSVLAHRLWLLSGYYGGCTIIPEENNYGNVLIRELLELGANVWRREEPDYMRSGRKSVVKWGYLTNKATKPHWVEAMAKAIFEQTFICRFKPAVAQLAAFIQNEDGSCEARPGAFDDFVAGIAIGLTVGAYKRLQEQAPLMPAYRAVKTVLNRAVS